MIHLYSLFVDNFPLSVIIGILRWYGAWGGLLHGVLIFHEEYLGLRPVTNSICY